MSDHLPTDDDIAFYRHHGWWVSPKILTDEQVETLRAGVERLHRGDERHEIPDHLRKIVERQVTGAEPLRVSDYFALINHDLLDILTNGVIARIAARLAGTDEIRLFQSGTVVKEPQAAPENVIVGWHTDRAYWQMCTSVDMLTSWIPLQDVDTSMGTLKVLDRSHAWPDTPAVRRLRLGDTFFRTDVGDQWERLQQAGVPVEPVEIILERGQVSFHHCLTLHGSGPNVSDRKRASITCHFQDGPNRWARRAKKDGSFFSHQNDGLVRRTADGEPDYADPDICPVLWCEKSPA